jgi:putative tricarboxylic transport membrane protein
MKKGNLIFALLLEGLGIWITIDSYRMGIKTLSDPGAGLFPFLLGVVLCFLVLPICITSLKDLKKAGKAVADQEKLSIYGAGLKKIVATMVLLIGYFALLDILGFFATTFLFLSGLFWIGYPRRWLLVLVISAITVILSYLIFSILLKTPFPRGFLNLG